MYIIYYDESGDDGHPNGSSPIFALSANYIHESNWRSAYNIIKDFRVSIKSKIPYNMELHVTNIFLQKKPYHNLKLSDNDKISIIDDYCSVIATLPIQVVNVVINKTIIKSADYAVLDKALTYSIQRVDNSTSDDRLLIVSDDGRIVKMRKTTRRLQVFNPIPSKTKPGESIFKPLERLIEDPLPKDSTQSYFVQVSDLAAFLTYNYMLPKVTNYSLNHRFPPALNDKMIAHWLDVITPVLNIKASTDNKFGYGIVCYPQS